MSDYFGELIHLLGEKNQIDLELDALDCCCIVFDEQITCQLELDTDESRIQIASFIVELPPGRFREEVLYHALIANDKKDRLGILGFSEQNSFLVLFNYLLLEELTVDALDDYLALFVEYAMSWKKAIEASEAAPIEIKQMIPIEKKASSAKVKR